MDSGAAIIIIGAVVAGFVQGMSGFAFSLVATAIWIWFLPPQTVAALAVAGAFIGQTVAAVSTRRPLQWPLLAPLLIGGLCGLPIGVLLLPHVSTTAFRIGVGLLLAVWCPLMLVSSRLPHIRFGGRGADALAGLAGGISGAFGGFTGPLPTLWCTLRGWDKDTLRGVIQSFNLVMLGLTLASYVVTGLITTALLPQLALVALALLLPVLLGARLYAGISQKTFRSVVLALLSLTGVALLISALPALFN
ncbi:MAG: sulfite exporter TauE/SafE family protein [Rubrivivax sp.]|nr:sulfite exporter TauE/SafE family protein [Rubrivivax sp.]